jgi:hypothetical protein
VRGWRTEAAAEPITTLATLLHASGLAGKRAAYEVPGYYPSVSLVDRQRGLRA